MNPLPAWRHALRHLRPITVAWALLALWGCGILVAGVRLESWRIELSRTLTQLNADAYFRARVGSREAVDPEWYRRKALALLSATQKLERDTLWTLFLPGSWRTFDPLEEQVQARLNEEFDDIVVETLRRELHARAARLTGSALARASGELEANGQCQPPPLRDAARKLGAAPEDLPEFVAVRDYVAAMEKLDRAVQSFVVLHSTGGRPEQLRQLVAYTLDQELPGALARSVRMFRVDDEVDLQPALLQARLQWAARCALGKAMGALYTRLLSTNDLLALEQGYATRSAGLFESAGRPAPFDRTLERYRAVHALLQDQHALLAKGGTDWMRQATLQLGPAYQDVLARIERTTLLGAPAVRQLQDRSGVAFAQFRRQFEQAFGRPGDPGIVWMEAEQRFALSPYRADLRQGLGALLRARFMQEDGPTAMKVTRGGGSLAKVAEDARALAAERARVVAEVLPLFPAAAQPAVHRVVDLRVSELIYQRAYRTLKGQLPEDPRTPLDARAFRGQRAHVLALHALLKQTGGAGLGERLVATLDGEVLQRLALAQEQSRQLPLLDSRLDNFAWWQGEPLSVPQAFGTEPSAAGPSLARTAARLDPLAREAAGLVALGSPALEQDPQALRWKQLQGELTRYQARAADSSLLRLERYAAALGTDFKRENCAERLAAAQPAMIAADEIAQRHLQLHHALSTRCNELRANAMPPAAGLQ
ncbi:MAG: hypothetical protein ACO1OY_08160 [Ramlibacter sp.]